ncbi:MAG: hypothetical protein PHD21_01295 [Flavobacteriales bacterium]|nr:hypothetical protein [Flavobacteriales bacterium]
MKKTLTLLLIVAVFLYQDVQACTSAIISGKITQDGRPLMWKQRDTGTEQNSVHYYKDGKYPFIGIVNSRAKNPTEVWMGTNSKGFSIMNTQSYNVVEPDGDEDMGPANGSIMRRALAVCATLEDFRTMLDTLTRPMMISANFGVIDANGAGGYFEVGHQGYVFYDVNDPKDAPCGYLARTNYSFSGKLHQGMGYVRFMTENAELMRVAGTKEITPEWIFTTLARSYKNDMLGIDLRSGDYNSPKTNGWFIDKDFIAREMTASSAVVQGVKKGEKASLTTMWTILGFPPASVVVPLWVEGAEKLPVQVVNDAKTSRSPLCDRVVTLKKSVFSFNQGGGTGSYFCWDKLYNQQGSGIMQKLAPVEKEIFSRAYPIITSWREKGDVNVKEMHAFYQNIDTYIADSYKELFAL